MAERFLLDTHTLIWWWFDNPKLPAQMRVVIADRENSIYVSAVAGWEIATKVRAGKLPEMADHIGRFGASVVDDGFLHLGVDHHHSVRAGLLPGEHRDPFDRLIAAQAMEEGLTVISRDPAIAQFGSAVVW